MTFFVGGQNLGSSPIANSGFFAPLPLRRGFLRPGEKKFHVNLKTASIKEGTKKRIIKHGNALHYYTPSRYRALRVIVYMIMQYPSCNAQNDTHYHTTCLPTLCCWVYLLLLLTFKEIIIVNSKFRVQKINDMNIDLNLMYH